MPYSDPAKKNLKDTAPKVDYTENQVNLTAGVYNVSATPYVVGTLLTGSLGLIAYLIRREGMKVPAAQRLPAVA